MSIFSGPVGLASFSATSIPEPEIVTNSGKCPMNIDHTHNSLTISTATCHGVMVNLETSTVPVGDEVRPIPAALLGIASSHPGPRQPAQARAPSTGTYYLNSSMVLLPTFAVLSKWRCCGGSSEEYDERRAPTYHT